MLHGASLVFAFGALVLASSSGVAQPSERPPRLIVEAAPDHPVFVGSIDVLPQRRADRVELLVASPAQSTAAANKGATEGLLRAVRAVLPGYGVSAQASAASGEKSPRFDGGPFAGFIRIDVAPPLDDGTLRHDVARLMTTFARRKHPDPIAGARIVSIRRGYASCAPFERIGAADGAERVDSLARAVGFPVDPTLVLEDKTYVTPAVDFPADDSPLCGPSAHSSRPTKVELPTSASFAMRRSYAFARTMRFATPIVRSQGPGLTDLRPVPLADLTLHILAPGPVLTLEGHAYGDRVNTGTFYEYHGPNGRYVPRIVSEDRLALIRRRVRALGVADEDIVTQIEPQKARWYVSVRTRTAIPHNAIVAAVAGRDLAERGAVQIAPSYFHCAATPEGLARAVSDAAARATRIAALLGATVDVAHPLLVAIERDSVPFVCPETFGIPGFTSEIPRRIAGGRALSLPSDMGVQVLVSFPIANATLTGRVRTETEPNRSDTFTSIFGLTAPPVEYPRATTVGEARRDRSLPPKSVRFMLEVSPDTAHAYRAIEPRFAATLAAQLGANDYDAWFVPPSAGSRTHEAQDPDALFLAAVVPYRGEETLRAANAVLRLMKAVGDGGVEAAAQNDDCTGPADILARDAIWAAAAQAQLHGSRNLVAIDVRGPFATQGACDAAQATTADFSIRRVTVPDVRLAAYARVSYARP